MKKFEYYLALRKLGIKEKHAVPMAKQATKTGRWNLAGVDKASEAISSFKDWTTTEEGFAYWDTLYNKTCSKEETCAL